MAVKLIPTRPSYSIETIKFLVGADEHAFLLHRDIVCAKSPFLEAACKKGWSEGSEGVVRLPKQRESAFKIFAHWIYSNTVDLEVIPERTSNSHVIHLVEAWILGDFLGCIGFCNDTMDSTIQEIRALPQVLLHHANMKDIPLNSNIGRLMVDHVAWCGTANYLQKYGSLWPKDFLLAVTKVFYNQSDRPNFEPTQQSKCYYHQHPEGTTKCA